MRIALDGSRYGGEMATGVEWYSFHIINAMLAELADGNDEVIIYSREELGLEGVDNRVIADKRLWTLNGLSKAIKRDNPDVLFVPSHVLPPVLPKRSVIMLHDVAFRHCRRAYGFMQYHYLNWSTKFAVKNATNILVPSEATKDDLMSFYGCEREKIKVIPHGFELPAVTNKEVETALREGPVFNYFEINEKTPYVLFVGRLESKKNLVKLVEAFGKFAADKPEWKLVLAGKRGIGFQEITNVVAKLNLVGKVVMPGYVTEAEKQALMERCQIFAFPSLYEGFGFPVLEAFHFGKPVITSNVSSLPEVAGEAAHYVDPTDVEAMQRGLGKLASDKDYRDKLVARGKVQLQKFKWKKAAIETLRIIHGQ